jgi:hypothetical protein
MSFDVSIKGCCSGYSATNRKKIKMVIGWKTRSHEWLKSKRICQLGHKVSMSSYRTQLSHSNTRCPNRKQYILTMYNIEINCINILYSDEILCEYITNKQIWHITTISHWRKQTIYAISYLHMIINQTRTNN